MAVDGVRRIGCKFLVPLLVLAAVVPLPSCQESDVSVAGVNGAVRALAVYNGDLIAGGDFLVAGDLAVYHVARWDGSAWHAMGGGTDGTVNALVVLGNELVAGGDFTHAGPSAAAHLACWDGSAWSPFAGGTDGPVTALAAEYGVFLYAAGRFATAGGVQAHGVARWFHGTWSRLGAGLDGTVSALVARNGQVVAAGDFLARQARIDVQRIAEFQFDKWVGLNSALLTFGGTVAAVQYFGDLLVIGGRFQDVWWGPTPGYSVARKVGEGWLPAGLGVWVGDDFAPGEVNVLANHGDALIAGGVFDRTDGNVIANNVARFDGTRWSALGAGVDGRVLALATYGGNLVAGGDFTMAGGGPAVHIALWDGSGWVPLRPTTAELLP